MTSSPSIADKSRPRFVLFGLVSLALACALAVVGWQVLKWFQFENHRKEATLALDKYDFPSAKKNLESCLALRPHDANTLLQAAQAFRRDGQLLQAQEYLDRYADEMGRSTPEGALQRVLLLVQRGQVKENVQALLDLVDVRHPQSEQILEALAVGCNHVYRMDEATFWIKQLQERYPANPIGRLLDAQTRETLRQRDSAIEILSRLVQDFPDNDKARRYYAGLLFKGHKYEEAVEQYRALLVRDPDDLLSLLGLVHS
ncbi:MAG: tetratricopeptide repeat protein, partial [Gemmataceae bacterium]